MIYSVWLVTRPISLESRFSALGISSDGKAHLRHWAVLISELTPLDAQVILQRTRGYFGNDDTDLGTMYELCREEGRYTNVNIIRPFSMETIRKDWGAFSIEFMGTTDKAHDEIKQEGNGSYLGVFPNLMQHRVSLMTTRITKYSRTIAKTSSSTFWKLSVRGSQFLKQYRLSGSDYKRYLLSLIMRLFYLVRTRDLWSRPPVRRSRRLLEQPGSPRRGIRGSLHLNLFPL